MGGHQPILSEKEIFDFLDENPDVLKRYLRQRIRSLEKLKRGTKCVACGQNMRARTNHLDRRLISLLLDAKEFLLKNDRETFSAKEVWPDSGNKRADFVKLQYFRRVKNGQGLIGKTKKSPFWRITWVGDRFIEGKIRLGDKAWIYDGEVVDIEDASFAIVNRAGERWQRYKSHYSLDYQPVDYQETLL